MTTLDDFEDEGIGHLEKTFTVRVGWNPDALTWVAAVRFGDEELFTEGATADRAMAAMVGKIETLELQDE